MEENKLINKLIFYGSYLHTLAEQGNHIFKTDTLKHIRLAREYILKATEKLKESKESKKLKESEFKQIYLQKYTRIKCPCSEEFINKINCHYCEFNNKKQDENYIYCNYNLL